MRNPWKSVQQKKTAPYVVDADRQVLEEAGFNLSKNDQFKIVPIPFMGNLEKAEVVILLLNPGFSNDGESDLSMQRHNQNFVKLAKKNLAHKIVKKPFFLLDEEFAYYVGFDWWHERTKQLEKKVTRPVLQQKIACINLFPYHSVRYKHLKKLLPSQEYGFYLVEKAIKQNKLLIVFNTRHWYKKRNGKIVALLQKHKNKIEMHRKRSRHLTRDNLKSDFGRIIRALV